MISKKLSCQELVELVTGYLEGALAPEERSRFEAHLAVCGNCRNYLGQMRRTIHLLGTLPTDALTPEAQQAFLMAFRDWKSHGGSPPRRWPALRRGIRRILRRSNR